jgi:RNA recognition motif-containing protein
MGRRLYVGNLSYSTTDVELREMFASAGTCESASVMIDRATGRSRGFGFVEMSTDEEAQRAITELNGKDLQGRSLTVNEAREKSAGGIRRPGFVGGGGFGRDEGGGGGFGYDAQSQRPRFGKEGGSRRGLRGKKRSL